VGTSATAAAAKSAGYNVASAAAVTDFIGMDRTAVLPESKPLTDVRVRQAMNYAVDRTLIVRTVAGGGTPTSEMTTSDGFDPKLRNTYPYNPAKAKSLLAAAGYANGFTLDLLYCPILYPNGTELAQVLAHFYGQVGIKVNLTSAPTVGEYLTKLASKKYSAFIGTSGALPMVSWVRTTLLPGGVYNPFGVVDATIAKDYFSALKAPKPSDYWAKISKRMTANAYFVPMYGGAVYVYSNAKKVKGVTVSTVRVGQSMVGEWAPAG
jgi:peptide/nickel transport system substrate-binding protein